MLNWIGLPMPAGVAIGFDGAQQPSMTAAMTDDKTSGDPPVSDDPFIDEGGEG
jgi:hypothetical protein